MADETAPTPTRSPRLLGLALTMILGVVTGAILGLWAPKPVISLRVAVPSVPTAAIRTLHHFDGPGPDAPPGLPCDALSDLVTPAILEADAIGVNLVGDDPVRWRPGSELLIPDEVADRLERRAKAWRDADDRGCHPWDAATRPALLVAIDPSLPAKRLIQVLYSAGQVGFDDVSLLVIAPGRAPPSDPGALIQLATVVVGPTELKVSRGDEMVPLPAADLPPWLANRAGTQVLLVPGDVTVDATAQIWSTILAAGRVVALGAGIDDDPIADTKPTGGSATSTPIRLSEPEVTVLTYTPPAPSLLPVLTLDRADDQGGTISDALKDLLGAPDPSGLLGDHTNPPVGSLGHWPSEGFGHGEYQANPDAVGVVSVQGEPAIVGTLDPAVVDRVVQKSMEKLRDCYQAELRQNGSLAGKVSIEFVISPDGSVAKASPQSTTMNNRAVEYCLASRFLKLGFPAPKSGIVIARYPLVFSPR